MKDKSKKPPPAVQPITILINSGGKLYRLKSGLQYITK